MEKKNSVIICSTLHEPEFRLKQSILSVIPFLKEKLSTVIISCTKNTSEDALNFLRANGFIISIPEDSNRISAYRDAIQTALEYIEFADSQRILYIDFDRLAHWIMNYPDEFLESIEKANSVELTHFGRTPKAFSTHPSTQKNTERIVNYLSSQLLGFNDTKDLISVCFSFTIQLADLILSKKYYTQMGFYAAFPVLLWNYAESKQYIQVEGLEWETPDRYQEVIKVEGYEKWFEEFQNTSEWKMRVGLVEDSIIELSKLYDFKKMIK
jgi:predicted glycosyltransferase involved in capsule biosynthesis